MVALVAELDAEQKSMSSASASNRRWVCVRGWWSTSMPIPTQYGCCSQWAAAMANYKIFNVYVGIAGAHIRSLNSSGMVAMKDSR